MNKLRLSVIKDLFELFKTLGSDKILSRLIGHSSFFFVQTAPNISEFPSSTISSSIEIKSFLRSTTAWKRYIFLYIISGVGEIFQVSLTCPIYCLEFLLNLFFFLKFFNVLVELHRRDLIGFEFHCVVLFRVVYWVSTTPTSALSGAATSRVSTLNQWWKSSRNAVVTARKLTLEFPHNVRFP